MPSAMAVDSNMPPTKKAHSEPASFNGRPYRHLDATVMDLLDEPCTHRSPSSSHKRPKEANPHTTTNCSTSTSPAISHGCFDVPEAKLPKLHTTDTTDTISTDRGLLIAEAASKSQELHKVRLQVAALNHLRDLKPRGLSGSVRDLKRTLLWRTKVLDEAVLEAHQQIEAENKRVETALAELLRQPSRTTSRSNRLSQQHPQLCPHQLVLPPPSLQCIHSRDTSLTTHTATARTSISTTATATTMATATTTTTPDMIAIPEWFAVLEARNCVPLLSRDHNSRFVELLNKIHRLERATDGAGDSHTRHTIQRSHTSGSSSDEDASDNQLLSGPGTAQLPVAEENDDPENVLTATDAEILRDFVLVDPKKDTWPPAEEYAWLMKRIDDCVRAVAKGDQDAAVARLRTETACVLLNQPPYCEDSD